MEIGSIIREHRKASAMSQDDLAAKVFVSRQTISSWENGKTYPDVQSLLLLSGIFGVTVDSLIKGDVETMNEVIERDVATIRHLGFAMAGMLLLSLAAVVWLTVQCTVWDWGFVRAMPTLLLALVLWGNAMFAAVWAERIKRDHDLVTFGEVLAFWEGRGTRPRHGAGPPGAGAAGLDAHRAHRRHGSSRRSGGLSLRALRPPAARGALRLAVRVLLPGGTRGCVTLSGPASFN